MGILRRQWEGYPRYHQSRVNLLLHVFSVPLFVLANIVLLFGLVRLSWLAVLTAVATMLLSLLLQGRGHRLEAVPAEPFTSPMNAMVRLLCEQWITFPRFVLSDGWYRALRQSSHHSV